MDPKRVDRLLGSRSAQKDQNFRHYAVPRVVQLERLRETANALLIINAPRGSGKSGLILALENELREFGRYSNRIVLKNIYRQVTQPPKNSTFDETASYWWDEIIGWLLVEIGSSIEAPADSDEQIAKGWCELSGKGRLPPDQQNATYLNLAKSTSPSLRESVLRRLMEGSDRTYWLLLDEMDDAYQDTESRNNSLAGFLMACNNAVQFFSRLCVRFTIRPHIYTRIKTSYDIGDKLLESEMKITWTAEEFRKILFRRIRYFEGQLSEELPFVLSSDGEMQRIDDVENEAIGRYFDDFDLSFTEGKGRHYKALHTISLGRPRWMLQYCSVALKFSKTDKAAVSDFQRAMHEFGDNLLIDLVGEHKSQIPQLESYLKGLAHSTKCTIGDYKKLRTAIIYNILRVAKPSTEVPTDAERDEALAVARSLYMVEVIRACEQMHHKDDHRFYIYADSPQLLASWAGRDDISWEIHPTFARALQVTNNRTYKDGPEVKIFPQKGRRY